jgi:hypothetical protein
MSRIASLLVLVPGMILSRALATSAQFAPDCEARPGELAMLIHTVQDRTSRVPLRDAVVTAYWQGRERVKIRTDSTGKVRICAPPERVIILRISYLEAESIIETTQLTLARITEITSVIDAPAIPLEPVVVTAFSRKLEVAGFYEREKRGVGTFIGKKQIDAMNVQRTSDLLRKVPSARIIPQSNRRNNAPANATVGRGGCRYAFLIDGSRTLADFEMDYVAPGAIEGVEVYNSLSEVPALFRAIATAEAGSALCGVVVIWTRDRH